MNLRNLGYAIALVIVALQSAGFVGGAETAKLPGVATLSKTKVTVGEIAAALNAHIWKFDLSLPADAERVSVAIEQQDKGQKGESLAKIDAVVSGDIKRELFVAIEPVEGTISSAKKVRITLSGLGINSTNVADNPLKGLAIGGSQDPETAADGRLALLGGFRGSNVSSPISANADKVIWLKIVPKSKSR
jgi:hypothetical protein